MPREAQGRVLSVVERGWRGARQCSIALAERGVPVTHLIKGWVPRDVRRLIRPIPGVQVVSVPRWGFWVALWALLGSPSTARRIRWVIVDHERTLRVTAPWCRLVGVELLLIRDTLEGYDLWRGDERVPVQALIPSPTASGVGRPVLRHPRNVTSENLRSDQA